MRELTRRKKMLIFILVLLVLLCSFVFGIVLKVQKQDSQVLEGNFITEPYGDGDRYFYVPEDYVVDGKTAVNQGYYENVELKDPAGTSFKIYIPIDKDTLERLPSDKFTEGTTIEVDGKTYEIHVYNNEYSITETEEKN